MNFRQDFAAKMNSRQNYDAKSRIRDRSRDQVLWLTGWQLGKTLLPGPAELCAESHRFLKFSCAAKFFNAFKGPNSRHIPISNHIRHKSILFIDQMYN